MGIGAISFPFPDMYRLYSFCCTSERVSHLPGMCQPDELGVSELDANNLPQSLAKEIRIALQPWDVRQPENVFYVQFPQKLAVLSVANAKNAAKIIKLIKSVIKFVKLILLKIIINHSKWGCLSRCGESNEVATTV